MHTLLGLPAPPTAVFATSAPTAVGVLRAIRERRLRCPQDVAVVAFDDEQFVGYLETTLTAVRWPAHEIAQAAADLLIRRIVGKETGPPHRVLLKPVLIYRESTLGCRTDIIDEEHSLEVLS